MSERQPDDGDAPSPTAAGAATAASAPARRRAAAGARLAGSSLVGRSGDDVHVDRPGQAHDAVDDRAADQLLPPRAVARAEHDLGGVLGPGQRRRARRRRRCSSTLRYSPPSSSSSWRCSAIAVAAGSSAPDAGRCRRRRGRRSARPWPAGRCAPPGGSRWSPPGAPVRATTTRSRVSHGRVMPWRSR